jgi:hypothetical protein
MRDDAIVENRHSRSLQYANTIYGCPANHFAAAAAAGR